MSYKLRGHTNKLETAAMNLALAIDRLIETQRKGWNRENEISAVTEAILEVLEAKLWKADQ